MSSNLVAKYERRVKARWRDLVRRERGGSLRDPVALRLRVVFDEGQVCIGAVQANRPPRVTSKRRATEDRVAAGL